MPWVKVDDGFPEHPKAQAAGPGGRDVFLRGLCYSAKYLTDGFLPASVVAGWERDLCRHHKDAAARLLHPPPGFQHGLWEKAEGGYRIHDYLDYSPSKQEVLKERAAAKERKDRWREKERRSERQPEQRSERHAERDPERRENAGKNDAYARGPAGALPSRPVPSNPDTLSPTPSPPGPTVPGPPREGHVDRSGDQGRAPGGETPDPEREFFQAYRRKTRELMDEFGSANFHEPKVQQLLAAWEQEWRTDHGLAPRNLEESA